MRGEEEEKQLEEEHQARLDRESIIGRGARPGCLEATGQ